MYLYLYPCKRYRCITVYIYICDLCLLLIDLRTRTSEPIKKFTEIYNRIVNCCALMIGQWRSSVNLIRATRRISACTLVSKHVLPNRIYLKNFPQNFHFHFVLFFSLSLCLSVCFDFIWFIRCVCFWAFCCFFLGRNNVYFMVARIGNSEFPHRL